MKAAYWPNRAINHPQWRFEPLPGDRWWEAAHTSTPRLFMSSRPLLGLEDISGCLKVGTAYVGRRHGLRAIRLGKSKIVGPEVWAGGVDGANATIEHCGVGGYSTPGALGRAVLREHYPPKPLAPISPPRQLLRDELSAGLVGGRCDLLMPDYEGPMWDADINMAYPDALREIPWGQPIRLTSSAEWGGAGPCYRWWSVSRAFATLDAVGMLGPLHLRSSDGVLSYPSFGIWSGWYWSDEIDRARLDGWICDAGPGWGWLETSDVLTAGAERLWQLRAAGRGNTYLGAQVEQNIKMAAVEAIGLWAVSDEITRIGGEGDGLEYIDEDAGRTGLLQQTERTNGSLLHLASWVYMRCRCRLYDAALPAARRGTLVATNFDEIFTTEEPTWLDRSNTLGEWKVRQLTNARAPKPRWIESDEKTRTPGVSR